MKTHQRILGIAVILVSDLLLLGCGGSSGGSSDGDSTTPLDSPPLPKRIATGYAHTCAIAASGTVKCWGYNDRGQVGDGTQTNREAPVDVVGLGANIRDVSTGWSHSCAVAKTGAAKCWGDNSSGQLGNGTNDSAPVSVDVVGLQSNFKEVSVGYQHTCALTNTGSVKCWGSNQNGQLGIGSIGGYSPVPVDVLGPVNGVRMIASGGAHTCVVTTAGAMECWGYNDSGQLGDGTTISKNIPVRVLGLVSKVTAIALGDNHTCALMVTGAIKCWGSNPYGQIGDGTTNTRNSPVDVIGLQNGMSAIVAGGNHTCALSIIGMVKCWGKNEHGQLGDGSIINAASPIDVFGVGSNMTEIAAGGEHTCAQTLAGVMKCWGFGVLGQLGDGASKRSTPGDVSGLGSGMSAIAVGGNHGCAVTAAGAVKCWGYAISDFNPLPKDILGLESGVATVTAGGGGYTCALTTSGGVKCHGYDNGAIRLINMVENGANQISTGFAHACVLMSTGVLNCWGDNNSGQLGNGTLSNQTAPVNVIGLGTSVISVSAGGYGGCESHTCAVTTTGAAKCWGNNKYGQLGGISTTSFCGGPMNEIPIDVTGLGSNVGSIATGGLHTCALTLGGAVKCWGKNDSGQLGNGTKVNAGNPVDVIDLVSGVSAITAGWFHSCALTTTGAVLCWGKNDVGQLGNGNFQDSSIPNIVVGLGSGVKAIASGGLNTCALTSSGAIKCWGANMNGELGDGSRPYRALPGDVVGLNEG